MGYRRCRRTGTAKEVATTASKMPGSTTAWKRDPNLRYTETRGKCGKRYIYIYIIYIYITHETNKTDKTDKTVQLWVPQVGTNLRAGDEWGSPEFDAWMGWSSFPLWKWQFWELPRGKRSKWWPHWARRLWIRTMRWHLFHHIEDWWLHFLTQKVLRTYLTCLMLMVATMMTMTIRKMWFLKKKWKDKGSKHRDDNDFMSPIWLDYIFIWWWW